MVSADAEFSYFPPSAKTGHSLGYTPAAEYSDSHAAASTSALLSVKLYARYSKPHPDAKSSTIGFHQADNLLPSHYPSGQYTANPATHSVSVLMMFLAPIQV